MSDERLLMLTSLAGSGNWSNQLEKRLLVGVLSSPTVSSDIGRVDGWSSGGRIADSFDGLNGTGSVGGDARGFDAKGIDIAEPMSESVSERTRKFMRGAIAGL